MASADKVNNDIYMSLGDKWYGTQDDPVALLRAEAMFRNPRVDEEIRSRLGGGAKAVLDIGCGGGFLTNYLGTQGHCVSGLDIAPDSLEVARRFDTSGTVTYVCGSAEKLPFEAAAFDAVTCMDMLEHVENPCLVVQEAARVLRPGGIFIYYTFNRTPLAWLILVKGVEWFVRNTPPRLHVYHLLVTPKEMQRYCGQNSLEVFSLVGVRPCYTHPAFWRLLATRTVPTDFAFTYTSSLQMGYLGVAGKK